MPTKLVSLGKSKIVKFGGDWHCSIIIDYLQTSRKKLGVLQIEFRALYDKTTSLSKDITSNEAANF